VLDAADRTALRRELESRRLSFVESDGFRVELKGTSAQAVIRALETPLTVLQVHSPSLEDAYLRIVGTAIE
jgi:ABC-2 type transport system ATP-binding protein